MSGGFRIEPLASGHDRSAFHSGTEPLDRYFREQASQDVRRRAALCYVAAERDTGRIAGYYTLAAASIPLAEMPQALAKRVPRYPCVPAARLGRLATDEAFRGRKLGAALLWDAAMRAARSEIAVYALIVDAKDEAAEAFYLHHGFMGFGSLPRQLLFPLASLKAPNA